MEEHIVSNENLTHLSEEIKNHKDSIKHLDQMTFFFIKLYITLFSVIFAYASFLITKFGIFEKYEVMFSTIGIIIIIVTIIIGFLKMRMLSHISKKRTLHIRQIVQLRNFINENYFDNTLDSYTILPLDDKNIYLKHFLGMPSVFNIINILLPLFTFFYINFILDDVSLSLTIALFLSFVALLILSNSCDAHTREMIIGKNISYDFSEQKIRDLIEVAKDNLEEEKFLKTPSKVYFFYGLFLILFMSLILLINLDGPINIINYFLYLNSFILLFSIFIRFYYLKSYLVELEKKFIKVIAILNKKNNK